MSYKTSFITKWFAIAGDGVIVGVGVLVGVVDGKTAAADKMLSVELPELEK